MSSDFAKPSTVLVVSKRWLMQIVSSKGVLVKSESTSTLTIDNIGSCSHISSANWNESLTVYLLLVKGFDTETKNLAKLYVRVYKADKIGRNGDQPSTCYFCALQSPYIVPGLVPTGFTELCIYFDIILELTRSLKVVSIHFFD